MTRHCGPRHRKHCSPAHAQLVAEYRDTRDAVDALRESGRLGPDGYSMYQLGDAELGELLQPVTFKQWLQAHRRPA